MSESDENQGAGPASAEGYQGPGYPTVSNRRRHLKKLALAAGAVGVGGGLFLAGRELVKPSCGTSSDGAIDAARGWLTNLTSDPPPHAAGGIRPMPPPRPDPRIRGDMVVPAHPDPAPSTCEVPKPPAPTDHPALAGEMAMPEHLEPPPEPPVPTTSIEVTITPPPPPPSGTVEGRFRSLYLTGATSDGSPFTVLLRVDPDDGASYEALKAARKEILTALSPLVGTPEFARDQAASKLVTRLVPGATVRFAGVVR